MQIIKGLTMVLLMTIPSIVIAQTGPGGVGNATNNVIWLDAGDGVYSNAGTTLAATTNNVQQWNDKSGNNKHATQATVGNRPNYITNVINGKPTIRFSAANNDHLISLGLNNTNNASVWFVSLYTSLPSTNPGLIQATSAGNSGTTDANLKTIGIWVGNDNNIWGRGVQSNNTIQNINKATTLAANNNYISSTIYRTNRIDQYVNNQISGSNTTHNGTLGSWTDAAIGRQGAESWNGDIAEMFIFNTEVNTAQRIIIDNYLAAKYNLTLTTNDLFLQDNPAHGNYDHEVAGIGRVDASNIHSEAQGTGLVRILNPTNLGNNEFLIWGHNNGVAQAIETTDVPAGVQARFDRTWRVNEVNAAGTAVDVGNIDMRFDLNGLGPVTVSDLRLLIDADNDGVFNDETPISGANNLGGGIYEFQNVPGGATGIQNNRRFTVGTINAIQTPLPIELIYFNTNENANGSIELEWATSAEINNDFFTIERSKNGLDWEIVKTVEGAGNSNQVINYQSFDESPYTGISYYRLKQIDYNGQYTYSTIKSVNVNSIETIDIQIYPNPTYHSITITGSPEDLIEIKVMNTLGQELTNISYSMKQDNSSLLLDLSNLSQGMYLIKTKTIATSVYKY